MVNSNEARRIAPFVWETAMYDAARLFGDFGIELERLAWKPDDLFDLPHGLVWFIKGNYAAAIGATTAQIGDGRIWVAEGRTMNLHLGIDIGAQGAVAILDQSGALLAIHDIPVLQDGPKGRRAINAPLLASIICKSHADHAFVEGVGARPGEGAT